MEITEAFKPTIDAKTIHAPRPSIPGLTMFAGAYFPDQRLGWLEVVQSDQRGQGVGGQSVRYFEDWIRDQGGEEVRGEALPGSLDFWTKMGYGRGKTNSKNRTQIRKRL